MKEVNVGLIGFGTVGTGLVKIFKSKSQLVRENTGLNIKLVRICDKNLNSKRDVKVDKQILTKDAGSLLRDPKIDIVVELIGGIKPAEDFIMEALANGKDVVTANKALMSQKWDVIFKQAIKNKRNVMFEASVCGAIPIIRVLQQNLSDNKINEVFGIVNGTANFILTKMQEESLDFKSALKLAQEKGYAELNPAFDIEGIDAAHKLAILSTLAFRAKVFYNDVYVEGIEHVCKEDISYANELGYAIKLLAIAKRHGDEMEVRVHPTLIPKRHLLASVRDVYNAVFIRGDLVGEQLFYGKGAGQMPTASTVMSDITNLAFYRDIMASDKRLTGMVSGPSAKIRSVDEIQTSYYLRVMALDKPGVLASIAGVLGSHNISISQVIQKGYKKGSGVPVVLILHQAIEINLRNALTMLDSLPVVKGKTVAIRIEEKL